MAWTPDDPDRYLQMYLNGASVATLVSTFGATRDKVMKHNQRLIDSGQIPRRQGGAQPHQLPRFTDFWELSSNDGGFAIATDHHAPFHSQLWLDRLLAICAKRKIRQLIVPGDGVDFHNFSSWGPNPGESWKKEQEPVEDWLWQLWHFFDKIYWSKGNHENRLERMSGGQLDFHTIAKGLLIARSDRYGEKFTYDPDKLVMSTYTHLILDDEWLVVHPASYRMLPLSVANRMAMVQDKHVISAHSHKANKGHADNGRVIIDTGGMFDEETIDYRAFRQTVHSKWQNGFVIYENGVADLYSDFPYTDWRWMD